MTNFDISGLLKDYFKDIVYIIGAITTFFVGKKLRKLSVKKEEINVQANELENVQAALKIYRLMLTDLQDKLKHAEEAYLILEKKLTTTLEKNNALYKENVELKSQLNASTSNNSQI